MKMEFHDIYRQLPESDSPQERFKEIYHEYREVREQCHKEEMGGDQTNVGELVKKLEAFKEQLSTIVIGIYNKTHSLQEFEGELKEILAHSGEVSLEEVDKYIVGSYLYPLSQYDWQSFSYRVHMVNA